MPDFYLDCSLKFNMPGFDIGLGLLLKGFVSFPTQSTDSESFKKLLAINMGQWNDFYFEYNEGKLSAWGYLGNPLYYVLPFPIEREELFKLIDEYERLLSFADSFNNYLLNKNLLVISFDQISGT